MVFHNLRWAELLASPGASMVGRRSIEFYADPEDRKRLLAEMEAHGRISNFEMQQKTDGGQRVWVSLSASLISFNGAPALLVAPQDITPRKNAEAVLKAAGDRLRA